MAPNNIQAYNQLSALQKLNSKVSENLKFKYPKFMLLIATFVLAYFIFYENKYPPFHNLISSFGYFGTFIAGLMFSYGFTTAPAIAIFMILSKSQNMFLATLIGATGALISDYFILKFIRHSFADEIEKLRQEKAIQKIIENIPSFIKKYVSPVLAGIIIASPLPDEIGVTLLAATNLSDRSFAAIDFCCNVIGILIILLIGNALV